jgi:hypothetical protein
MVNLRGRGRARHVGVWCMQDGRDMGVSDSSHQVQDSTAMRQVACSLELSVGYIEQDQKGVQGRRGDGRAMAILERTRDHFYLSLAETLFSSGANEDCHSV